MEKAHGKFEHRAYCLVRPTKRKITKEWTGLKAFVCSIKTIEDKNGTKKEQIRKELEAVK